MKRISDKKKIPEFFNNKRYDEYYKNYKVRGLSFEIQERQNISSQINSIVEDNYSMNASEEDDNKKVATITRYRMTNGNWEEYTPPQRTTGQIIEDEKNWYLTSIEGFTQSEDYIEHPTLEQVINSKKPRNLFPGLALDSRPYIQPIKEVEHGLFSYLRYRGRQNFNDYYEYPSININLDFSDDAILTDIKQHLTKLRKRLKHKPKLLPPKEFIKKFKNFRTLQVIDMLLWQKLTDHHIEYETLADFLFPQGQFSGKQLRERIIPFSKKLLNSKSNESAYMFYLSDKK